MLAYVQTSEDLVRSLRAVDQAKARVPAGQNVVTVAGEAAWPLTWYLRDVPTAWASRIEQASTPVIIADWDAEGALEKQLADKYDAQRVPIRAWWFPEIEEGGRQDAPDASRISCASGSSTRSGARSGPRTRRSTSARTSAAAACSSR